MSFVKYEPKGNIAYLIIDREKAVSYTHLTLPTNSLV